ncbi:MAG: PEPxxWA-CTERM sorting domain-containing protein [Pseudomonadota bacterium]
MRLRSWIAASALSLALATPALADIAVLPGVAPGSLDTVVLSDDLVDFVIDGLVDGTDVTVTGSENLILQGQTIEAQTGTFNFLLFTLTDPGSAFTAAQFNLDAVASGPVSIFAYDQFGDGFGGVFALAELGDNIFNVAATNGQIIRSIVIMSTAALSGVSGIQLGGITTALVPEPGTWAMMIAGFGGVGLSLRTRRRLALA